MSTNKSQDAGAQEKRPRRKRTREDRQKRDAAFTKPRRGRPAGTTLSFFEDADRFAIAMIYCGETFIGLPRYVAAYAVIALTSQRPIDARLVDNLLKLAGSSDNATLKGRAQGLVAKCGCPRTSEEAHWITSSAAYLGMFVKQMANRSSDPGRSRAVIDGLAALGWTGTLKAIIAKASAIAGSNLPPSEEPVSRRVKAFAEGLRLRPKS